MWHKAVGPLSQHFRVIVPDLPGFGASSCPPTRFSTVEYAEFLDDLLDEFGVAACNIAGVSYGGEISAYYSSRRPERVQRLILIASTGLNPPSWFARNDIRWMIASAIVKRTLFRSEALLARSAAKSFHDIRNRPEGFSKLSFTELSKEEKKDALLQCMRNISSQRNVFEKLLQKIVAPALILWGADDRILSARYAPDFRKHIPNAEMKVIMQCGHSVPLEKPEELCGEIINFLLETSNGAPGEQNGR